jgi:hypothetical protein
MKTVLFILACGLLTGCASSSYVAVQSAGGGDYYIAQTPGASNQMRYEAGYYSPFYAYGLYPWWSYTYYSPNFYPHYFSVSYPSWPYYHGGFGGWNDWYGRYPYGFATRGGYPPGLASGQAPIVPVNVIPVPESPARVVAPAVVSHERNRQIDTWERRREFTRPRSAQTQPGEPYLVPRHEPFATPPSTAPVMRPFDSVDRPSLPSFSPRPPAGSGPGGLGQSAGRAGRSVDRSPLERHP